MDAPGMNYHFSLVYILRDLKDRFNHGTTKSIVSSLRVFAALRRITEIHDDLHTIQRV